MNDIKRLIKGSSLILAITTLTIGCASQDTKVDVRWSDYARSVAADRLALHHRQHFDALGDSSTIPSVSAVKRPTKNNFLLLAEVPADETAPTSEHEAQPTIERGPLPGFFDTVKRDLKAAPGVLWEDTKSVYTDPWNVIFLVGAGGASLALRPEVDDDIEDYYDDHHTMSQDWRDFFSVAGNPGVHFALAGAMYGVGQQIQDAKTYEVGKNLFSAVTITGLSTMLLKVAANTDSPNGENWAWPSGHVSSTMAVATVLNDAYGPLVGVPMFGLTALVGLERLDDREHHFSDLIFGAALGWVVAETVIKKHSPEIFGGQIRPYIDPISQSSGIAWVKTLGN